MTDEELKEIRTEHEGCSKLNWHPADMETKYVAHVGLLLGEVDRLRKEYDELQKSWQSLNGSRMDAWDQLKVHDARERRERQSWGGF